MPVEYEGHVLWAARTLAAGGNIYAAESLVREPLAVFIYNPLYIALGALLSPALGAGFFGLRLLSMVGCLAAAGGLYRICAACGCRPTVAALAVAYFLSFLPVAYWSCLARVDSLGLALSVWSIERLLAAWRSGALAGLAYWQSLLLITAAFYTKQQYFVVGIASALFLGWSLGARAGASYFACGLALFGAVAACLQAMTGGYLAHLSFARGLPWEWKTLQYHLALIAEDPKTVLGLILILASLFAAGRLKQDERLPGILFVISLPLLMYTMGLRGAYHNHLLTVILALSLWTALALRNLRPFMTAAAAIVVALSVSVAEAVPLKMTVAASRHQSTRAWMDTMKTPALAGALFLSEDPSLPLALGARLAVVDMTTFMNVWRNHPSRFAPIIDSILARRYAVIIMNEYDDMRGGESIWPPELVQAVKAAYEYAGTVSGNGNLQDVYVPARGPNRRPFQPARKGRASREI